MSFPPVSLPKIFPEVFQTIGTVLILFSITGLAYYNYRRFRYQSRRPLVEVYIILVGFFMVGVLGIWLILSTHPIWLR
jgi:hypothetical protein